jgi:hypothetical protein
VGLIVAGRNGVLPVVLLQAVTALLVLGPLALGAAFFLPSSGLDAIRRLCSRCPLAARIVRWLLGTFVAFAVVATSPVTVLVVAAVRRRRPYYFVGVAIGGRAAPCLRSSCRWRS